MSLPRYVDPAALAARYPVSSNAPLPTGFRAPNLNRNDGAGGLGGAMVVGLGAAALAAWWAFRQRPKPRRRR